MAAAPESRIPLTLSPHISSSFFFFFFFYNSGEKYNRIQIRTKSAVCHSPSGKTQNMRLNIDKYEASEPG